MAHNQNQNHLDDEDGDGQKEISFGFERIFFWLDRARLAINEFSFGWIEQDCIVLSRLTTLSQDQNFHIFSSL